MRGLHQIQQKPLLQEETDRLTHPCGEADPLYPTGFNYAAAFLYLSKSTPELTCHSSQNDNIFLWYEVV